MTQLAETTEQNLLLRKAGLCLYLAGAYIVGMVFAGAVFLPIFGIMALVAAIGGFLLALPLLAIACLCLWIFERQVRARPRIWCLIAPIGVAACWIGYSYLRGYSERGYAFIEYLDLPYIQAQGAFALVWAVAAGAMLRHWLRNDPLDRILSRIWAKPPNQN